MNKNVYYIFSYAISVMAILASVFLNPENIEVWLIFVVLVLFAPVFFYKIADVQKVPEVCPAFLVQMIIWVGMLCLIIPKWYADDFYHVAITKSPQKANEIQEFLTTEYRPTRRAIWLYVPDNSQRINISIPKSSRKENRKAVIELLNSDIIDDSVGLNLDIKYTKNKKTLVKRAVNESKKILYLIDGITYVYITTSEPETIDKKLNLKYVKIYYTTAPSADNKKIDKLVEKFAVSAFSHCSENITVKNDTTGWQAYELWKKAQAAFVKKDYALSKKLLQQAAQIDNVYSSDIEKIAKIVEIEKKIKKYPNNYKYYIELADLQNPVRLFFSVCLYNPADAVKNYEKALTLNPNAVEVYKGMGDAYYNLYGENLYSNVYYEDKAAEYYLKAVSVGNEDDLIYSFLGKYYLDRKEYNSALMYYNKMDNSACFPYDSNKKAYLYLKTGKFKDFYRETKCCNVFFCRLIRFNFKKDDSEFVY